MTTEARATTIPTIPATPRFTDAKYQEARQALFEIVAAIGDFANEHGSWGAANEAAGRDLIAEGDDIHNRMNVLEAGIRLLGQSRAYDFAPEGYIVGTRTTTTLKRTLADARAARPDVIIRWRQHAGIWNSEIKMYTGHRLDFTEIR